MKKFLPLFLTLFYSSILLFSSVGPALAQTDLTCSAADLIDNATGTQIMTAESCQAIKDLFNNSQRDGPWYDQNPNQFAKKVFGGNDDEIFGERYTFAQINWIINSIAAMLNPASGISNPKQLFDFFIAIKKSIAQTQSGQPLALSDYAKLGPAGLFAGGISALYTNPPASGIQEIKYTASKIFDYTTGTEPAYAQGYGFSGLNSGGAVRALWTASRNMAYLIMTILLIASGFLIMFRVKINPQTVVSLQTMIPKLIITMILVTFSFAIAGLVIDLIYVFIAAFVGLLSISGAGSIITDATSAIKFLTSSGPGTYMITQLVTPVLFWILIGTLIVVPLGVIGSIATLGIGGALTIFLVALIIVVMVVYLITIAKIIWMLMKTYIVLVLQICIAPLQIMLDLIPGQQGFGPWIRNLIANASVFAVVPIIFLLQNILTGDWITGSLFLHINQTFRSTGGTGLQLPFTGNPSWIISFVGGFVIFTMTPKIADMIRDALKIPAFKYSTAIGEALTPITKPVGGTLSSMGTDISKNATSPVGHIIGGTLQGVGGSVSNLRT